MTIIDWKIAIAERCTHLAGLGRLPPPAMHDPALQACAVLSLAAEAGIHHALTPASTMPRLTIPNAAGRHAIVDDLLSALTQEIAAPSRDSRQSAFSASGWIAAHGLDELVLRSVRHTADDTGRAQLLADAAHHAQDLMRTLDQLRDRHMRALLERDAPDLGSGWRSCDPTRLAWVLAHEHDGSPSRAIRVQRRLQALRLYASLADRLREPSITAAIDEGRELIPALTARLGISPAQLSALREATPPHAHVCYLPHACGYERALRHLQAHAVPLHEWPGGGRPGQHTAWQASLWLKTNELTLIRADYYGTDPATVRDAVRGFQDDLLAPLLAGLAAGRAKPGVPEVFATSYWTRAWRTLAPNTMTAIQMYLACIRRALVGERGPKAFQEAAKIWHRRAAAVAALRNENQTDRPGWPPLCPPWTSPCGAYQIVPLTTAKALVEEGNAHEHCVGTYYETCRRGATQILSMRQGGKPMVTAEILLDERISALRVGQFKGLHDEVPDDPALHEVLREFLHNLCGGAHPLHRQELRAYRRWAERHYEPWRERPLPIAHARQVFPLYLALLPRGTPAEFDRWCEQTGLRKSLRAALRVLARHPPNTA